MSDRCVTPGCPRSGTLAPFYLHHDHSWCTADGWWFCEDCHMDLKPPSREQRDALERIKRGDHFLERHFPQT